MIRKLQSKSKRPALSKVHIWIIIATLISIFGYLSNKQFYSALHGIAKQPIVDSHIRRDDTEGWLDNVQVFYIPGSIDHITSSNSIEKVYGVLLLMLRILAVEEQKDTFLIRGHCTFQLSNLSDYPKVYAKIGLNPNSRHSWSGGRPYAPNVTQLELGIRTADKKWQQDLPFMRGFSVHATLHNISSPLKSEFETLLQLSPDQGYEIFVHGWHRFVQIHNPFDNIKMYQPQQSPQRYFQVVSPAHGGFAENLTLVTSALQSSIKYHAVLGFDGTIFSCRQPLCSRLAKHPDMQIFLSNGRLQLFSLDSFGEVEGWHLYVQNDIIKAIILSFWGTNTRLFISDLDEFFAFPYKTTVQAAMDTGCLASSLTSSCVSLMHRYVYPNPNSGWSWQDLYNQAGLSGNPIASLTSYTPARAQRSSCTKTIINPNEVYDFFVHHGLACTARASDHSCTQFAECVPWETGFHQDFSPDKCAFIAHYRNMYRGRDPPTNLSTSNEWLWPLKEFE